MLFATMFQGWEAISVGVDLSAECSEATAWLMYLMQCEDSTRHMEETRDRLAFVVENEGSWLCCQFSCLCPRQYICDTLPSCWALYSSLES